MKILEQPWLIRGRNPVFQKYLLCAVAINPGMGGFWSTLSNNHFKPLCSPVKITWNTWRKMKKNVGLCPFFLAEKLLFWKYFGLVLCFLFLFYFYFCALHYHCHLTSFKLASNIKQIGFHISGSFELKISVHFNSSINQSIHTAPLWNLWYKLIFQRWEIKKERKESLGEINLI